MSKIWNLDELLDMASSNVQKKKKYFTFSFFDFAIMVFWLGLAASACMILQPITPNDNHVALIFVLAIFLTAITTEGYLHGLLATVISVYITGWAFTKPYWAFDYNLQTYQVLFTTMAIVGVTTAYLTSLFKEAQMFKRDSEIEKTRANLLRSISHDLRTPLAVIIGDADMVLANEDKEENKYLLNDISSSAEWLVRMVENILSITRMDGQVGSVQKCDEIPEEIIGGVIGKFKKRFPNMIFEVSSPDEAFFVPMDHILIEQLFLNLFDNALSHGHATEIKVMVTNKGNQAEFVVSNNGEKIPEEILETIFDEGINSVEVIKKGDKFMGIGLTVCRTVVEAHGGCISACNTNDGVKFIFNLSMKKDEANGTEG